MTVGYTSLCSSSRPGSKARIKPLIEGCKCLPEGGGSGKRGRLRRRNTGYNEGRRIPSGTKKSS
jgi:hypothetical protein